MKKILAVTLAVLMLLPMFASLAFAEFEIPEGTPTENIAGKATISVEDTKGLNISVGSNVDVTKLNDGDRTTGTTSPKGMYYSYMLDYDDVYYFTDIKVAFNGSGVIDGNTVTNSKNIFCLQVNVYYGDQLVYEGKELEVENLTEISVQPNVKGDRVEIFKVDGKGQNEYMWEIETYAPDLKMCSAQLENVASKAIFSATGANNNNFWATKWSAVTDGDIKTGTHSPQGKNYSIWMNFEEEYLFSDIDIECNTEGGAKLVGTDETLTGRTFNVALMRVILYNSNDDIVWDSDITDVSTITTFKMGPYVEARKIEIRIYNGNWGGGEYLYEISTYAQSGDHVFETSGEENPTCMVPGFREYSCQCGKTIKKALEPTGFHKWDEGTVTRGPSNTENGILTVTCTGCGSTKLYDVPSLGHNFVAKETVPAKCDVEGYTLYECTDDGCDVTYKGDHTPAKSHNWDTGKVTKKPTIDEEGIFAYTCTICGEQDEHKLKKHEYTDKTTDFVPSTSIVDYKITVNTAEGSNYTDAYIDQMNNGVHPEKVFDGNMASNWYAPGGSYFDVILDREYVFTSGYIYVSSNYSHFKVEFLVYNSDFNEELGEIPGNSKYEVGATCNVDKVDNGSNTNNPSKYDLNAVLKNGVKAVAIRVHTVGAKWPNGSAATIHELQLRTHACDITKDDYILEGPDYVAPTCDSDGKCLAQCQVCGNKVNVVIESGPDAGHSYDEIITDKAPTCTETGLGHAECTKCHRVMQNITIPTVTEHKFDKFEIYVTAKCGFAGVQQEICSLCGSAGKKIEIAPTGIHEFEWATKSLASYTAVGKTELCCIYCDSLDVNTEENVKIAPKLEIPADVITFVGATKATVSGKNALSLTYKLNLAYFPELEQTCDLRAITTITDAYGRQATIESYGKFATNEYNPETGEFTVTIYPGSKNDVFEISTVLRVMNFRGTVYVYCSMGSYGSSISMNKIK